MRDQYKLLAEKYNTILEGEEDGPDDPRNLPGHYTEFVQKAMHADNIDDFEKILTEFAKQNYYQMNKFALYDSVEQEVAKVFAGIVNNNVELSKIRESLDMAIYYMLMYVIYPEKESINPRKPMAEKSWKEWNYSYNKLKAAQKDLEQKNKETGINLDI